MTETDPKDLDLDVLGTNVGVQVHLTRRALWARAGRERPQSYSPRPSGYVTVLVVIGANPGVSQKRLADQLFLDAGAIGDIVDHLEGEGLAERRRDPTDRRRFALYLTDAGQLAREEARIAAIEHDRAVTANLAPSEIPILIDMLKRLRP